MRSFTSVILSTVFAVVLITEPIVAVDTVTINAGTVLSDVSAHPIGINLDYLMDDDTRLSTAPARSTRDALAAMGVKFLRYPGGEKSQNYLWSVSPWTSATPRSALPKTWPATDKNFFSTDGTTPKATTLDFDEFMTMARSLGAEPVIVVNSDSQYVSGGPTKETLLLTAENWVRYANIVKGYGIKYWMIGNETWNTGNYAGHTSAANHKTDVIAFSQRMKAVDPTIKIVACGNGTNSGWNSTVLSGSNAFDYLTIGGYFNPGSSYTNYQNLDKTYQNVTTILSQIVTYSQVGDGTRIRPCYYEWNGVDWNNTWANTNDLGHALLNFQIQGDLLNKSGWDFSCLWNTRWVGNDPTSVFNALKADGSFTAVGQSLAIWGKNLKDKMVVCSSSTQLIRAFACTANADRSMNAFFINKDAAARSVSVTLSSYTAQTNVNRWQMAGTGSADQAPSWTQQSNVTMNGSTLAVTLPAVSITMLTFTTNISPPQITSTAPTTATVGTVYTYTIATTGTPTLSVSGNPAWLTLSGNTLSGTPTAAGATGTITVTANNGVNPNATQTFSITVVQNRTIDMQVPSGFLWNASSPTDAQVDAPSGGVQRIRVNPQESARLGLVPALPG